ncbi:MBL fold metallo-hydrolase [Sodalis sp. CWE]|uniref:MBL fold metallo-hydrolase n=1 Tax=Sodalis sp. CWE TaxID=2803816 RepID=UPI001C7D161D|nr:MBL fold metallo-hydrolase [Sodalis sp. CWE]MBX4181126.1 MBL fold metallo-hydrolase [Sodalis sp. CWE]
MEYFVIPVTAFNQNCSLVWCKETGNAVIVDPGGEAKRLQKKIAMLEIVVKEIWLTHGHLDHVGAASELAKFYKVPIIGPHHNEKILMTSLPWQCQIFGMKIIQPLLPDRWLQNGEILKIGKTSFHVLHCPGHSPGHVVFWNKEKKFILMGDVLFNGRIGCTNLPGGNISTLLESIHRQILPLEDSTVFLPGHGLESTLGNERKTNPFLK